MMGRMSFFRVIPAAAIWCGALLIGVTASCGTREDAAGGAAMAATGSAPRYSGLVVFGDSLSDSGNAGRFSNGPVWVEVIAARIGAPLAPSRLGGTNYAIGGARTHGGPNDLRAQAAHFLATQAGAVDADALYVVYAGANDLLSRGCGGSGREEAARAGAAAIRATIDDLATAGARHILVPNLPDIGLAPVVRAMGPACAAEARQLTHVFNDALEDALRQVDAKHGVTVRRLDVWQLADAVSHDPEAAGFTDVASPCKGGSCQGALFWDYLHPSADAHVRLAEAALAVVGVTATP
jgi:phospholipase/lecithinase/hemolysin